MNARAKRRKTKSLISRFWVLGVLLGVIVAAGYGVNVVEQMSNVEIGLVMNRSEGAVKALHHRTLRRLLGLLAGQVEA